METVFGKLNARQREAACAGQRVEGAFHAGPLLIIAGAGTGKTNTLAHRVAHLVLEKVAPERILLLTFTRRAAVEMTRRTQSILALAFQDKSHQNPETAIRLPWSGTFHSVANRLIRRHCARVGLDESFSVLDRGDAADLMDVARHELGFSKLEKRFPRKDTCLAIYSHKVNTQGTLAGTLRDVFPWCAEWEAELKALCGKYVEKKLSAQALDYDDLLLYWHAMMADAQLAQEIGGMFDHILVDEYQDTNLLQAEIVRRLRPDGTGVTVVGDDAQAIYSFRAATVENILNFPKQYNPPLAELASPLVRGAAITPEQETRCLTPICEVITLEENYRSTQPVLDAANALLAESNSGFRKNLSSTKTEGQKPRYVTVADDAAQAQYVVAQVLEKREQGVDLKKQAVLFRSSHHSDVLELELVRRNIPYVKYGGLKFLEAAHVKDLLAVLRWADNPKNRVAAWRALQLLPGVGPATTERTFTKFEAQGFSWLGFQSPSPEFDALMRSIATSAWEGQVQRAREWYQPHLERKYDAAQVRAGDLLQLEKVASSFNDRQTFLAEMALDPPSATSDLSGAPYLDEDFLILSTVHSAKGQEWDAVHVLNVSDGNFPNEFSSGKPEAIEEERRLLYVAMTRAKSDLHLIAPMKYYVTQQSRMGDRHVYGAKSRFLTRSVINCLEQTAFDNSAKDGKTTVARPPIDVAASLKEMWA